MMQFPPLGGSAAAVCGGEAAEVQTQWAKRSQNGRFWLNGTALWRIRCQSWRVVRTRTFEYAC